MLGSLTLVIFLLWSVLIGCCMCCGQDRVGYLSGRPFMRRGMPPDEYEESSSQDDDDDNFDDEHRKNAPPPEHPLPRKKQKSGRRRRARNIAGGDKCCSRPSRVRFFFILCGCTFITFSILLVTEGMTNLQTTVDTMDATAQNVHALAKEVETILNVSQDRVASLITSLQQRIEKELQPGNIPAFCPADPDMSGNEVGKDIVEYSATAMEVLQRMEQEFVNNAELSDLQDTLTSAQDGSQSVSDSLAQIDMTDWQALIVLLPFTIVPALLISATIMAYFDVTFAWFSCLLDWFLVPVFILLTWFMCFFTSFMAITSGVNSDFCLPGGNVETASPDHTVFNIMEELGYGNKSMTYTVSKFYIDQCIDKANDPLSEVKSYLKYIKSKERVIQQLTDQLTDESNVAELSLHCNRNLDGVDLLIQNVQDLFRLTLASVQRIMDLLSCERIVPLYTTSVYEGTCEYSSKAVFWIYCSALVMAVMGMLMITLRASYKLSKYDYDPDYQDDYENKDVKDDHNMDVGYDDDHDDYQENNNTNRGSQHYDDFDDGINELPPPSKAFAVPKSPNQPRGTRPARVDDFDRHDHHHDEDVVSAYPDATSQFPMDESAANNRNHDRPKHHGVGVYDDSIPASDERGGARGGPPPSQYQRVDDATARRESIANSSGTAHFSVSSNQDDDAIYRRNSTNQDDDVTFDEGDFNNGDNVYAGYDSRNRRMSGMSEDPPEGADYR